MKKFLIIAVLSAGAGWLHFKTENPGDPHAGEEALESPGAQGPLSKDSAKNSATKEVPSSSNDRLFEATQKLAASDFSSAYTNGQHQGYKNFDAFFDSKPGGKAALAALRGLGHSGDALPDDAFAIISESLSQVSIKDDPELRLEILGDLAQDTEHLPAIKTLAMKELFTKMPHTDERDNGEHQRAVAAYQTFLATQPDPNEILRVTVDSFYFNEDASLNEEFKGVLGEKFPELLPKIESRYRDPAAAGASSEDDSSPATPPDASSS